MLLRKVYVNIFVRFSKAFSRKNLYYQMKESIMKYRLRRKGLRILNVGSGGEIANRLKKYGVRFKELDIDPARKPDLVMDIQDMHMLKDNSINVIFCFEVLEHVKNPQQAVGEIRRVLKKGGLVIGSTPFIMPIHDEPYDFYRYTRYGLLYLFREFSEETLIERNSYMEAVYVTLIRVYNIGSILERLIAVVLFPFFLLALPFFLILSIIFKTKKATTGYFFIFRKTRANNKTSSR